MVLMVKKKLSTGAGCHHWLSMVGENGNFFPPFGDMDFSLLGEMLMYTGGC
jgi:hypothetical protein